MHSEDILKRTMNTSENREDTVQNVLNMSIEAVSLSQFLDVIAVEKNAQEKN